MKIKFLIKNIKDGLIECFEELTEYDIYCSCYPESVYFRFLRFMS